MNAKVVLLEKSEENIGYNAKDDKFEDMFKAGVIDPTKVTRTALQNAASIGGLILITEAIVTDKPEKEKPETKSASPEPPAQPETPPEKEPAGSPPKEDLNALLEQNRQAVQKLETFLATLQNFTAEDPFLEEFAKFSEAVSQKLRELSTELRNQTAAIASLQSRIDTLLGIQENPVLETLEGDLKKLAMEIDILPTNNQIPLEVLARRAGVDKETASEKIQQLIDAGIAIELRETEEKTMGLFPKKTKMVVKRY